jgi:hypothetical protein
MKLSFAFLATSADHTADGRLWIAGADFDGIDTPSLPTGVQLVMVAKIGFDPGEADKHELSVAVIDPLGEARTLSETAAAISLVGDPSETRFAKALVQIGVSLENFGKHFFRLSVDGHEIAELPLNVKQAPQDEDDSVSWEDLNATAMSPERIRSVADYLRSTGQASA